MRLRLTILRTELKLFGLFVVELFLLNPLALVLILEFPLFFMLLWVLEGGIYFTPIGIYMLLLLAAVIIRKRQIGPDRPVGDLPLQKPLNTDPLLRDFVERVASRFRKSAPRHSFISLSPNPWHRFGVDLRTSRRLGRGLPLPITYLEILSIPELEAYIARVLVSHRGPFWLFIAVEWAIERLGAEQYQAQFRNATHRIIRARGRALQRYVDAVNGWRFLVDLDADLRVAQVVGADAVISLAYKTELANFLAAPFISEVSNRPWTSRLCCRLRNPMQLMLPPSIRTGGMQSVVRSKTWTGPRAADRVPSSRALLFYRIFRGASRYRIRGPQPAPLTTIHNLRYKSPRTNSERSASKRPSGWTVPIGRASQSFHSSETRSNGTAISFTRRLGLIYPSCFATKVSSPQITELAPSSSSLRFKNRSESPISSVLS